MKHLIFAVCLFFAWTHSASTQVVYTQSTGNGGFALFQVENGNVVRLPTGFTEHNFPIVSRDSRFIVFSTPDPVVPALQVPPSSDVIIYDRVFNNSRRVINNNTTVQNPATVLSSRPLSAALSPNNRILAFGMEFTTRQGTANPSSGRNLIIANSANGVQIDTPRLSPLADSTGSEFVGISWDPSGTSFVTPMQVNGLLTGIVRIAEVAPGDWQYVRHLSTPVNNFPAVNVQMYPALSPSGAGLAYFDVHFPGVGSAVTTRLFVADAATGNGATVLATFNSGIYPAGLAWSRDGTHLIFSVAQQLQLFGNFLTSIDPNNAGIGAIPSSGGPIVSVNGIGDADAFFPSVPDVAFLPRDTARPFLKVKGKRRIKTRRSNVVIKGRVRDNFTVARVLAKAGGAKVRKTRVIGGNRFKVVLKMRRSRAVVRLNAIDRAGLKSKKQTIRVVRP